ncbi:hypothetical protein [Marinobacter salarius]|uniref:hypothetical protein n=1 Tax=Marinobacter salarius TaxID=1420917 RepID=UPI001258DD49|nr:hypothetical protein [Marinobacter salarius]VVT28289.1 conserved hypothetical protein [Marinobacter salarius]
MTGKVKISFDIDNELLAEIQQVIDESPVKTRSHHISALIKDGLDLREKLTEQERRLEFVSLKTLFFMRQLVRSRGDEVLKEMDRQFRDELPEMKHLILENGIDYEHD